MSDHYINITVHPLRGILCTGAITETRPVTVLRQDTITTPSVNSTKETNLNRSLSARYWAVLSNLEYIFETAHPTTRDRPDRSDTFGYDRHESVMTQVNEDER